MQHLDPIDTMQAGLRAVAAHRPVTPITVTLRGLLLGSPPGWQAVPWCAPCRPVRTPASVLPRRRTPG